MAQIKGDKQHWVEAKQIVEHLLVQSALYAPEAVESPTTFILRHDEIGIDAHCIHCNRMSTFSRVKPDTMTFQIYTMGLNSAIEALTASQNPGFFVTSHADDWDDNVYLKCARNPAHEYIFAFRCEGGRVQKIGQYPSLEDITSSDLDKYRKFLGPDYGELRRAGGLFAHGIGVGSYVYLRRVFERLIVRHYVEYRSTHGEIPDFATMRMDEKVDALLSVLPSSVSDFKGAYGFLSLGIHELSEDFCKKHFPLLRSIILAIVEEDYQQEERDKARKTLREEFARAKGEASALKGDPSGE